MKTSGYWSRLLKVDGLKESRSVKILRHNYVLKSGILRSKEVCSKEQAQTRNSFAFKWKKRGTYDSKLSHAFMKKWLVKKYLGGDHKLLDRWLLPGKALLDAGCGSCFSSLLLFGRRLNDVNFLGVDISEAVDIAKVRFEEKGIRGEFLQADLMHLPFSKPTFDMIFSEGVLHHTDCPEKTFMTLAKLIKPDGRFMFYVYRKKAPIREFADDYIRNYLKELSDESAWKELLPLTMLGKVLGNSRVTVNIPKAIPFLGIPSGKIDLQRLFYWYIFKAFYRPGFNIEEMNHVNFDWYRPLNCYRLSTPEIKNWCRKNNLIIERLFEEDAGISVVAKKRR
jgi:SAM-dependent methyltransferase